MNILFTTLVMISSLNALLWADPSDESPLSELVQSTVNFGNDLNLPKGRPVTLFGPKGRIDSKEQFEAHAGKYPKDFPFCAVVRNEKQSETDAIISGNSHWKFLMVKDEWNVLKQMSPRVKHLMLSTIINETIAKLAKDPTNLTLQKLLQDTRAELKDFYKKTHGIVIESKGGQFPPYLWDVEQTVRNLIPFNADYFDINKYHATFRLKGPVELGFHCVTCSATATKESFNCRPMKVSELKNIFDNIHIELPKPVIYSDVQNTVPHQSQQTPTHDAAKEKTRSYLLKLYESMSELGDGDFIESQRAPKNLEDINR